MSLYRLSNNKTRFLLCSIFSFSLPCFSQTGSYVDIDHTTANHHGLYEIREMARKFVIVEDEKNHTNWEVLDPNLKIFVPPCMVSLKARWAPKDLGLSNKSVLVLCTKTVNGPYQAVRESDKKWEVAVPVALPHLGDKNKGHLAQ